MGVVAVVVVVEVVALRFDSGVVGANDDGRST